MAITWTEDAESRANLGFSNIQQNNIAAFAASDYAPGGYTIDPLAFGFGRLRGLWEIARQSGPALGVVWEYDKANKKLQAFWTGAGTSAKLAEVATSTDFSGTTIMFKGEGF